ncbi:MAG: ABC transporter substrate-binding protein [Candidatus Acidiferrales bacterium]
MRRSRETRWRAVALVFAISLATTQTTLAAARPGQERFSAAPGMARVVTDATGRRVTIPGEVKRIVTLAPNLTETIYALGLEDRLAGDTDYCDTPEAAKSKPHVGSPLDPNLEAIVAMHPDIVLATTSINRRETVDALAKLGIAVYATDPRTVRGTLDSIARLADLLGAGPRGETLVARLQARLDALHARLEDRPLVHVLFVVWVDPLITIGQNTFIADALRWAGAESVILSNQNWPTVSLEEVVRLQPDYIVLTRSHIHSDGAQIKELSRRPVWKELRAVQLGHVVVLGQEIARPSPGLVDDIEALAHAVHPEAFATDSSSEHSRFGNAPLASAPASVKRGCDPCAR